MKKLRYTIEVCCQVPDTALREITRRFGNTVAQATEEKSVIVFDDLDQASLRALMQLLWDLGLEVLSVKRHG